MHQMHHFSAALLHSPQPGPENEYLLLMGHLFIELWSDTRGLQIMRLNLIIFLMPKQAQMLCK